MTEEELEKNLVKVMSELKEVDILPLIHCISDEGKKSILCDTKTIKNCTNEKLKRICEECNVVFLYHNDLKPICVMCESEKIRFYKKGKDSHHLLKQQKEQREAMKKAREVFKEHCRKGFDRAKKMFETF